jgi:hypothetical protein
MGAAERPAHHLDVKVPLAQDASGRLTHDRVRLYLEVIEAGSVGETSPELCGLVLELGVRELLDARFEGVDRHGQLLECLELLALARVEDLLQQGHVVGLAFGRVSEKNIDLSPFHKMDGDFFNGK